MKQTLQLRLSQQLNLTPQLQQAIKLLQLSTLDFQQELEQYLSENPLLERGEEAAAGEAEQPESQWEIGEDDGLRWEGSSHSGSDDDEDFDPASNIARDLDLREYLLQQAGLLPLSHRDKSLLLMLIEALDDDGFLSQSLEEVFSQLPEELIQDYELEPDDLRIALIRLQHLEPLGVGARDTADCLCLQLRQKPDSAARELALKIAHNSLDLLAGRDYTRLKRTFKCEDGELKAAQELIVSLNPRPSAQWSAASPRYVSPDVIVQKVRGAWRVRLHDASMPKLRVNRLYADILQKGDGGHLARELQEARWLVKSVQQRFDTILRVATAIVERQRAFFEHGEVAMRPLVLRDIAEELDLHESTISRVTTQKYMLTPRGLYEFKFFFGSHVDTDAGGECSATAIKALIKQMVQQEDKRKPLSDSVLAEALSAQGIVVARRTVAKYREALQIYPVSQRKSL
ncbi:RNA polymerase factor sigma-54 [Iodobacter ciconiae]|uniref:RNA polymerase sigma-54 factor n=1 Tax=Iodobacter ciconiae TaxID=2496266 RepID=A0A3S8ZUR1_9NEIS|nr:RNA polymerase factor sigma-54 [Iodobacter ciconiae]AZN37198.1 RNA polymerase factor sigma-54 [Iodobacter ciconiae]